MIVRTALAACLVASAGELYLLCSRHWLRLGHLGKEEEGWGGRGSRNGRRPRGRRHYQRISVRAAAAGGPPPRPPPPSCARLGLVRGQRRKLEAEADGSRSRGTGGVGVDPLRSCARASFRFPPNTSRRLLLLFRWRDSAASPLLPLPSDAISRNIHVLKRTAGPPPGGSLPKPHSLFLVDGWKRRRWSWWWWWWW